MSQLLSQSRETYGLTERRTDLIYTNLPTEAGGPIKPRVMISQYLNDKMCGHSICKPSSTTFNDCLKEGKFPRLEKSSCYTCSQERSLVSIPISLLTICSKIFELLIYNDLFTFFTENNLISPNQSGFRPGGSCVNQLIAFTHKICKSFDDGLERGVFLV